MARSNTFSASRRPHPLLKLALEVGPLVLFFLANQKSGIFWATGAFMAATAMALAASWIILRRLPVMPLVAGVVVLVFGSLTLLLHDATFIKVKPTIVNLLFAGVLLGGLALGKPVLRIVFEEAIRLDEAGWRKLTLRWGVFFVVLAALNEIVWRTQTTDVWVSFKVFAIAPLTILFMLAQVPLFTRHALPERAKGAAEDGEAV